MTRRPNARRPWTSLAVACVALVPMVGYVAMAERRDEGAASTPRPAHPERTVHVKVYNRAGELVGPVESPRVVKTDAEWRQQLTPEQFKIARASGTERPFCSALLDSKKPGVYACVCCGLPLFETGSKFDSGTGWPSFFKPIAAENVRDVEDRSHGMVRVETVCARCDAHLGHVFEDGPRPTGLRYCMNGESLRFVPAEKLSELADPAADQPTTAPAR